jgi:hypothetical protein
MQAGTPRRDRFVCDFSTVHQVNGLFRGDKFPQNLRTTKFAPSITTKRKSMVHRTQLSTALLITVKAGRTKQMKSQPAVAGIKITARPATIQEKGQHSVDELGNIVSAADKKSYAL